MARKAKPPCVPVATRETVRQEIIAVLRDGPCSARDLSAAVRIPEREVYGHLEHIQKTLASSGLHLVVESATCRKCGFLFIKRGRLQTPGRCPVCKGESIREPRFGIEGQG